MHQIIVLIVALFPLVGVDSFYVPGVAPENFKAKDNIDVKAIKLQSMKTHLPYDYYKVAFCRPAEIRYFSENLGEVLRGDRIVNTAFKFSMNTDVSCQPICGSKSAPSKLDDKDAAMLLETINDEYHVHLLVDNLPVAVPVRMSNSDGTTSTLYDHGYRLGYVNNQRSYVNNHLAFKLKYHENEPGVYRVVAFEVEPSSRDYKNVKFNEKNQCEAGGSVVPLEVTTSTREILWTYSVVWEASDIPWASRWDVYLASKDAQIHWFSIVNSIVVVACLSAFLALIMVRTVRRDIQDYNNDEDAEDTFEETGWKLVHGDVFRSPPHSKLLTSLIGAGIQLFGTAFIVISFAMLGMLSPSSRGSLMTAALSLYCLMGCVAGYYSGRLYKTIKGVQWKRAALQVAMTFPGGVLGVGLFVNFFMMGQQSSGAVPFTTMLLLLFMWLCIDLPLVFLGFSFGFRKQAYQHPVRTNQIPRQVPTQPWFLKLLPSVMLAGILPFGAMFIELLFIFSALWQNQFYYLFGFLFLVFFILVISAGQIAIASAYFQLCAENYHWWWRSFTVGGSCAIYVFLYSIFYYMTSLDIVDFTPSLLYFAYSLLMSFAVFLFTGTIGFYASYAFLVRIYGAVKID